MTARRAARSGKRRSAGNNLRYVLGNPVRQLRIALLCLAMLVVTGTLGYRHLEGMGWVDALYMTVITVATVGYGEIHPLHTASRLFTIGIIVLGVGIGAWTAAATVEVLLGQSLWLSVQRRKMKQSVDAVRDHFIVCGHGRLGTRIVRDLETRGERYVVVDRRQEMEEGLAAGEVPYVMGDATSDEVLLRAGVTRARGLVATLDSDASNVLAVLTARLHNPDLLIVARANSESSEHKLLRAGADRVVTPESIGGHRLALALLRPAVNDLFNEIFSFGHGIEVDVGQITVSPGSPVAGQTVEGCDLRRLREVTILAVRDADGHFTLNPDPKRVIAAGETLIVIGPAEAIYGLEATYGSDAAVE
ncbi:MAG TPA: NAD-binding protein [Longimicrobiaceae bacterium]|nr:NAD-binding protein [Longimicrobiaceae bacterium]